ncbi:MAG TPA: DUF3822 family protein [Hanamia sp.]|nr:DUF3822 family protein [Hanamia sp.]
MRTVFEILPSSSFDAENCSLLCEVSNEGFSFCVKDEIANSFLGLAIYHYDLSKPPIGLPIDLQVLFHQKEILSGNFKNIFVVYSFPQSVLVPFSLYDSKKNSLLMNMMYGDLYANETILTDLVSNHSVYNCYRIPASVYEVVQNQYPNAVSNHQYSFLLKEPFDEKNILSVIFYSKKLIAILVKNGQLQLMQSFNYHTPEDVSYILLNICNQFYINSIKIEISGLIEENSSLYKEIYKFFTEIEFTKLPGDINYSEEIKQYPSHYFSYIFALNSCV